MLLALSNSPTNLSLTKLNIGGNDLSGKYFELIKTQARSCFTSNRNSLLGVEAGLLSALTKVERVSLAGVSLSSEQASSLLVRINVMIKMLSRF